MCSLQLFDWRKEMKSSTDKFGHILETGLFSDVKFALGSAKEVIQGHKIILMTGSRVFQELLEGKKDEKIIQIPEIEPKEFRQLLKYLYTGDKGYKKEVNFDPMAFLKALKYFEVEELYDEFILDLVKKISVQNALEIYEKSKNLKTDQLTEASELFIMENANEIIQEPSFLKISLENLKNFLISDNFKAKETRIVNAVFKWFYAERNRQQLKSFEVDFEKIIKELIKLIRFPLLSPYQFTLITKHSDPKVQTFLDPEQIIRIFQYFHLPEKDRPSDEELGFISRPRAKKYIN